MKHIMSKSKTCQSPFQKAFDFYKIRLIIRIISWILNADIILNNADNIFKDNFLQSILIQINHLKKNIKSIPNGLETIKKLQGRTFEWKASANMAEGVKYGLIAQELEAVLPDCVTTDIRGVKTVDTDEIMWHMLTAIKELSTKVKALESA